MASITPRRWVVVRITRIDQCGRPVYGECNAIVSRCIATIADTAETEEPEVPESTGFDGRPCLESAAPCPTVLYHSLEISWREISMDGFRFLNPAARITYNDQGEAIGRFENNEIDCSAGYAIEVWAEPDTSRDACTGQGGGEGEWYYRVYPWVTGATPGDITMGGSEEISFTFTGRTKSGSQWGSGPWQITLDNGVPSGLPGEFDPDAQEPYWEGLVTLPPPEPSDECIDVERPIPEPATLTITGRADESPRCTVDMFVDNNGLGPVTVDWGDGSPVVETPELTTVSHTYADCSYTYGGGETVIRVCDAQDPEVCAEKAITLPLPPDEPEIAVSDASTPEEPNRVKALVVFPPQATGSGTINWGDRQSTEVQADASNTVEAFHVYRYPGRYRACASRDERPRFKGCQVVTVPMSGS